jgi:thiamine-monophosphate kinase
LGRALAEARLATAMIDVSDGPASDLRHICNAGKVGAVIDQESLPIPPVVWEIARTFERDIIDYALHGGEDYELLFTAAPENAEAVTNLSKSLNIGITRIGAVTAETRILLIKPNGESTALQPRGWDHFGHKTG